MLNGVRVVLASGSPRRKVLLAEIIGESSFDIVVSDVEETVLENEDPSRTTQRLAQKKAAAVAALEPRSLIVAADTVVAVARENREISLGKPESPTECAEMIQLLSGRTHRVLTGFAVVYKDKQRVGVADTQVTFRTLSDSEIAEYITSPEPYDKAGGYAIQGLAKKFITAVEGSVSNVVGLPLAEVKEAIESLLTD